MGKKCKQAIKRAMRMTAKGLTSSDQGHIFSVKCFALSQPTATLAFLLA